MRACATYVMPCNLEMAIEPDLREMVLQGLAGAEAVHQAHRMFEGSALSGIGADLLIERDEALGRLSDEMTAAKCAVARQTLRDAEMAATRAYRAEAQGSETEAVRIWKGVFGDFFPAA